jgi:hypothetical protein
LSHEKKKQKKQKEKKTTGVEVGLAGASPRKTNSHREIKSKQMCKWLGVKKGSG